MRSNAEGLLLEREAMIWFWITVPIPMNGPIGVRVRSEPSRSHPAAATMLASYDPLYDEGLALHEDSSRRGFRSMFRSNPISCMDIWVW